MRSLLLPILFLIIFYPSGSAGQTLHSFPQANGATYNLNADDAFSFGANPGSLGRVKYFTIGMASERKFMLEELQRVTATALIPTALGNLGAALERTGNIDFTEMRLNFGYARKLTAHLDLGIRFNYFNRAVANYGNETAIIAEAGLILHLSEQFITGVHIYNPGNVLAGKTIERISSMYAAGFGFAPSEKFFLSADIQKTEDQPVNIHTGVNYCIVPGVKVSAGITSAASSFYFGTGILTGKILITLSASMHPSLGITPGLMLAYTNTK